MKNDPSYGGAELLLMAFIGIAMILSTIYQLNIGVASIETRYRIGNDASHYCQWENIVSPTGLVLEGLSISNLKCLPPRLDHDGPYVDGVNTAAAFCLLLQRSRIAHEGKYSC